MSDFSKLIKEFIFDVMTSFGVHGTQKYSKSKVLIC